MFGWFRKAPPVMTSDIPLPDWREIDLSDGPPPPRTGAAKSAQPPPDPPKTITIDGMEFDTEGLDPEDVKLNYSIGKQCQAEMLQMMRAESAVWTHEQRMAYMLRRAIEIRNQVTLMRHISDEADYMREQLGREISKAGAQMLAQRHQTSLDQLMGLVSDHPFLAGMIGADVVHKIKKLLPQT